MPSMRLDLGPTGTTVDLVRVIHRGRSNLVVEARARGLAYALKIPNRSGYESAWECHEVTSEVFYGCGAHAAIPPVTPGPPPPPVAPPDDLWLRQLLQSEHDTIASYGTAWNAGVVAVVGHDAHAAMLAAMPGFRGPPAGFDPAQWCLVMPLHPETALSSLPAGEQTRVWLRALPALWTALSGRHHGDLAPGNLLVADDRSFFRLVDPMSARASMSVLESSFISDTATFVTTPIYYPLTIPHVPLPQHLRPKPWSVASLADAGDLADRSPGGHHGWRFQIGGHDHERHVSLPISAANRPPPQRHDRPSTADTQALGFITFHLLTGRTLLLPDVAPVPAWTNSYRSPGFETRGEAGKAIDSALASGYLASEARVLPAALTTLTLALVEDRMTGREDLLRLVRAGLAALQ